ncbi:MAG TPA: hypothetical protein VF403_08855 [Kofleriaceae bacterium]
MRDDEPGTLSDVRDTVGGDSTLPQIHSVRPVETALPQIDGMYSFDEIPTTEYLVRASAAGKMSPELDVAVSYATARVENLDTDRSDVPRQDRMSQDNLG